MVIGELRQAEPQEEPDIEPVPCVECGVMFKWWIFPVQLCDSCVDAEYVAAAAAEEAAK